MQEHPSEPARPPGPPEEELASRRQLLLIALIATLSVAAAMAVGFVMLGGDDDVTVTRSAPLPALGAAPEVARVDGIPLWLVRTGEETVDVFWARSPSVGDAIDWVPRTHERWDQRPGMPEDEGFFVDTRTGARWTLDGAPGWGPTFRGLDRFAATIDGAEVRVTLDRVLRGLCDPGVEVRDKCSTPGDPQWERGPVGSN